MKKYKLNTIHKKLLADTLTPVGIYLKLRDKFPDSILLESSDYHGQENSFSFICCEPLAGIKVENEQVSKSLPDGSKSSELIKERNEVLSTLNDFLSAFETLRS